MANSFFRAYADGFLYFEQSGLAHTAVSILRRPGSRRKSRPTVPGSTLVRRVHSVFFVDVDRQREHLLVLSISASDEFCTLVPCFDLPHLIKAVVFVFC